MKQLDTLKDLIPDTANVNKGSERGNYMLDWSISQLGAGRSILADADGRVIAGNKTLDAAAERDLPIRVVQTDGKELVVVQRTDLRLEGEGDERTFARQLAIADNRTSEIGYVADAEMLLAHLQGGVDLSAMYSQDELTELLESITPEITEGDGGDEFDTTPETEGPTRTNTGDLWIIGGKHRLICGDSTKAEDVTRLMGGDKAELCLTDPPYAVDYSISFSKREGGKNPGNQSFYRESDNAENLLGDFLALLPTGFLVMTFPVDRHLFDLSIALAAAGFVSVRELVWIKDAPTFHPGATYQQQHEPILVCRKIGVGFSSSTPSDAKTVIEVDRTKIHSDHPTERPQSLWQQMIAWHTVLGSIVYDPFLGTGTTVISAHRQNRICYGLEIEPRYCDVILKRAEAEGLECVRQE